MHEPSRQGVIGDVLDVVAMGDDPHFILWRNKDILSRPQVCPLAEELPVRIEDLDPVILTIADIDSPAGINGNRVRCVKFSRSDSSLSPSQQVFPVTVNFHDA